MVHSPPLAKHLAVFQLEKESDNPFDLGCLLDFKETLADCDDPSEKMALKKHFPKGLRSRLLLDLEFLGAGMGGCGGIEIGVLYAPHSGTELLCWFDLETSEGKVLASLVHDRSPWFGPELVRLALKSLGDAVVCNSALTTVENLLPGQLPKHTLRQMWKESARDEAVDTAECLALFDQCYSEKNKVLPM